ncbi:glycosyltransferase family 2 protein [Rhodococcus aerolatus]
MPAVPPVRLAVVVPAHDEEELLPACLASLRVARSRVAVDVLVVVVLDRCTDGTAAAVAAEPDVVAVVVDAGNVGVARAAGARAAVRAGATWLACTDADGTVAPDWLVAHLRHARSGVAAVAGSVVVDHFRGHPPEVGARWHGAYRPGPGHHHEHGANLGVRAGAYRAVGGFAGLAEHEDVDLLARLRAAGHAVVAVDDLGVTTSGRVRGRVGAGFAGHLRSLADAPGLDAAGLDAAGLDAAGLDVAGIDAPVPT